jgi:hypothetical protein
MCNVKYGRPGTPEEVLALMAGVSNLDERVIRAEHRELKTGLQDLATRLKPATGPDIPSSLWDEILGGEHKDDDWSGLDVETLEALYEKCDDYTHQEETMLTLEGSICL